MKAFQETTYSLCVGLLLFLMFSSLLIAASGFCTGNPVGGFVGLGIAVVSWFIATWVAKLQNSL